VEETSSSLVEPSLEVVACIEGVLVGVVAACIAAVVASSSAQKHTGQIDEALVERK